MRGDCRERGGHVSVRLRTCQRDRVALLELAAPERRNALSSGLLAELNDCLAGAVDAASKAVVLTGAGGVFSAGADLTELSGTVEDRVIDENIAAVADAIRQLPVPVIAAVEGACIGAAVDLVLACDLAVASASAFFEIPAVRLGLLYRPASIARWQRTIPRAALFRLLVLGDRIDADDALRAGLVGVVVSAGQAETKALALAGRSTAGDASAATKRLLTAVDDGEFDPVEWETTRLRLLASEQRWQALRLATRRKTAFPSSPRQQGDTR